MKIRDILLAVLITLSWGSNWMFIKTALVDLSPFTFNAIRMLLVSLMAIPFIQSPKGKMKEAMIMGMIFGVGHIAFCVFSMGYGVDISTAVILGQINVPLTCVLGSLFLNDKLGWRRISALVVAFAGVIIFAGTPHISANIIGISLVICTFTCWAITNVYSKAKLEGVPPLTRIGWSAIFSLPFLFGLMFYVDGIPVEMVKNASMKDWGCIFYTAIVPLLVGCSVWQYLLNKYDVSIVAPFSMLTPFFGSFFGVMFFDEAFTQSMIIGGAFIMTGVAIIVWRQPQVEEAEGNA